MIESEDKATSENPPSAGNARRSANASVIAMLLIAAALVVSNWFFYQQGQRDAAVGNTEAGTAATPDALMPLSNTGAQPAGADDRTTMPSRSDDTEQPAVLGDVPKRTATEADAANAGTVARNDNTTVPAASDGSAAPVAPGDLPKPTDAVNIDTMVVHPSSVAARVKPAAKKRSLASLVKPTHPVVVPENRDVVLLGSPRPAYPSKALRERQEGTVLVLAQVDVQGNVSDARVIGRSGSFALDRAATNEVRSWQFRPALQDGKPVVASVQVPVNYRLDQ